MNPRSFNHCCRNTAIEAFQQGIFYLLGCETCATVFSITDQLDFFMAQCIAYHKLSPNYPHPFDAILFNGKIIFMIP